MIYVTRKMRFCAAHRLFDPRLSEQENRERFGDCVNLHGHNYTLEVTFAGEPDERTGMLIHLSELDALVRERVVDRLDHKNLNVDVPLFRDVVPTVEMIAKFVWGELHGAIPSASLHCIRVHEDDLTAEYYGE